MVRHLENDTGDIAPGMANHGESASLGFLRQPRSQRQVLGAKISGGKVRPSKGVSGLPALHSVVPPGAPSSPDCAHMDMQCAQGVPSLLPPSEQEQNFRPAGPSFNKSQGPGAQPELTSTPTQVRRSDMPMGKPVWAPGQGWGPMVPEAD